ncbi:type II toxin-antitoxin system RelE/ParE family toxin [Candidatus Magnetobacterium casense]|uniref:Type II toxin-antitoxin system RelE/ParE family toxin n=1 Tax=Candidatus Magnetobacterium casense TaxID=1455061 RepID=A0ABS6S169_9BACT|nr:type II toxin-antitoxin system RelE/ParE family toxin [Candidatus Magnetobacterium casensis]MBV6342153.1 type II toxin-antitoxin system RelE/ParE family toxin [Candidatus Magnetobacterium casensis]
MDYSLMFNNLSIPASDQSAAYELLIEAFQGVLHLNQNEDRFELYFDTDNPAGIKLAESFTYEDFKEIVSNKERDLYLFITQIEDKAPFYDSISDDDFNELTTLSPYFKDHPYNENLDIFSLALYKNGVMLSLATDELWQCYNIDMYYNNEKGYKPTKVHIFNISGVEHAKHILIALEESINDCAPDAYFTKNFLSWFEVCGKENQHKIKKRLKDCHNNGFNFVRPIIDTLNGSQIQNMKEIRFGNAQGQHGKIRILFAKDKIGTPVILEGFIKHGNDYTKHIRIADSRFDEYLKTLNIKSN